MRLVVDLSGYPPEYTEGFRAAKGSSNPYQSGTRGHFAWTRGRADGERDRTLREWDEARSQAWRSIVADLHLEAIVRWLNRLAIRLGL